MPPASDSSSPAASPSDAGHLSHETQANRAGYNSRSHLWLLPAALLVQRGVLFARYGGDLDALFRANAHWITVQLQARAALDAQPLESLFFLQQAPPVPNAWVAALLQILPWPAGVGWALVATQALCTLAVAFLLVDVARRLAPYWAATALGLLWIFSPDVVVLEVTGMGQTFYENLAVLGVLASVHAFLRWCETGRRGWAVALGVVLGLLALTRSSYGFYSLPVLAMMTLWAAARPSAGGAGNDPDRSRALRQVLVCAAVALSLQGAWSLKNLAVFGHWTWPASTWGGASLAASIERTGAGDALVRSIEAEPGRYPAWFLSFVAGHGAEPWSLGWRDATFCPADAREHDRRVARHLHGENRPENTQCLRLVSQAFGDASVRFLLRHPEALARKLKLGYATYWFPLRYHGGQYLSLFSTDWAVERALRPWRSAAQLLDGELPEDAWVHSGTWPDTSRRPARLFTLDRLATAWWLVEIVVLHLVTPWVLLAVLWRLVRRRSLPAHDVLVLFLAMTFAYSAGLHNLAEFGENMRFRWNVEPVIWLLVADSLRRVTGWIAGRFRRT